MNLNENKIIEILKEEYDKRIAYFLLEDLQIETSYGENVWEEANQLKVKHKESGLEFTFCCFNNKDSILYCPEESRFDQSKSSNIIKDYRVLEQDEYNSLVNNNKIKSSKKPDESKSYIVVNRKTFEKEYSL